MPNRVDWAALGSRLSALGSRLSALYRSDMIALTRPVPASIANCELTHLERQPIDFGNASRQHDEYENVLRTLGCKVTRLAGLPDYPDSVFIEDTALVLDECAIITRPGAESRRGEIVGITEALGPMRRL